jgi:glycosyltransferase involved in cell wall biosynthesis
MKILQIITSLGNGGAEKFTVELSNELTKESAVTLCTFKAIEDWMMFPKKLNASVELISLNKQPGIDLSTFRNLLKLVSQTRPDVINLHLDGTLHYFLPIIPFIKTRKIYYTIHSNLNSDKHKLFNKLNKVRFISKKIRFVCISESILKEFRARYPELDFTLIENGTNRMEPSQKLDDVKKEIDRLKSNPNSKVFLTVSNYTEPKNLPLIFSAFKKLHEEKNDSVLLVIGNEKNDETLRRQLENMKSPNIHMIGVKNNVQDYLHFADAYCLCSVFEGLPISIIEAYSHGKPVISTPAGGIPSILTNGVNGFLSTDFTLDSYHSSLLAFLNAKESEIAKIKKNNLDYFEKRFDIKFTSQNYFLKYNN